MKLLFYLVKFLACMLGMTRMQMDLWCFMMKNRMIVTIPLPWIIYCFTCRLTKPMDRSLMMFLATGITVDLLIKLAGQKEKPEEPFLLTGVMMVLPLKRSPTWTPPNLSPSPFGLKDIQMFWEFLPITRLTT